MFYKTIKRRQATDASAESLTGLSKVLQRVLLARGVDDKKLLDHSLTNLLDYKLLANVEQAANTLLNIIKTQQTVCIVGDFDADGATSTALLMLALPKFGLKNISYVVPNRFDYGYGLSPQLVNEIANPSSSLQATKPDWIITVDNGISSVDGVELANRQGIKVLVTDHHLPGEQLPDAAHIVNPNLANDTFPSKSLAGVGVAFYLLIALRAACRAADHFTANAIEEPNLAEWLDIVALGTVADVVPLDHNNRILVEQGLKRIRGGRCRLGISALLNAAKRVPERITASDLGFAVGPRLNAAGRLEDMSMG
ncbi:MAG: DHH family phosphoesterase, partial [Kangiellaceae bacterium]|nr:DHH family phosphoesterase [Kangiellaceae bacterium]